MTIVDRNDIKYFSSIDLAKLLGVHVSSIKRWTNNGKLKSIKTAGGHRKFLPHHISDFLIKNHTMFHRAQLFPLQKKIDIDISFYVLRGNFVLLGEHLKSLYLNGSRCRVSQILYALYTTGQPLYKIYDELVTPLLQNIGDRWENGRLSIIREYAISQSILDSIIRLQGLLRFPNKKKAMVFCVKLSKELHDIALKMVDHISEEQGFRVCYCGQPTPFLDSTTFLNFLNPKIIFISSTYIKDFSNTQRELEGFLDYAKKKDIKVYVGGKGFNTLDISRYKNVLRLYSFKDVYRELRKFNV